jgi:NTE family protein
MAEQDETADRPDQNLPIRRIPTDPPEFQPEDGIALCLSGGGYRATLFHLGALWRLNEVGLLSQLDRVSSVSGGSIVAALLGLKWDRLALADDGVSQSFVAEVVEPIRRLTRRTIDVWAILRGLLGPGSVSQSVAASYRRLYGRSTLQDLPARPRFVINATNIQSGVLWRFSNPYTWDYRVGKIENPKIELAVAVAASSAFPPLLSPAVLRFDNAAYAPQTGMDLQKPPFTTRVVLTDGGVYDNLGLETAFKRDRTIIVSDAGGELEPDPRPKRNWISHTVRVLLAIDNQVRSLRKRQLINAYIAGTRQGTYFGIRSDIANYKLPDVLPCSADKTLKLADVPTRLKGLDDELQERLINWGYAICDAALRRHVEPSVAPPKGFPYPAAAVG